jgi:hypothetical protein
VYYSDYDAHWWQILKFKYNITNDITPDGGATEPLLSRLTVKVYSTTNGVTTREWKKRSKKRMSDVYLSIRPKIAVYGHKKEGKNSYTQIVYDWDCANIWPFPDNHFESKSKKF